MAIAPLTHTFDFTSIPVFGNLFSQGEGITVIINSLKGSIQSGSTKGRVDGSIQVFNTTAISANMPIAVPSGLKEASGTFSADGTEITAMYWQPFQRAFGPIHIEKVGVGLIARTADNPEDQFSIVIEVVATLVIGKVTIGIDGLGVQLNFEKTTLVSSNIVMPHCIALEVEAGPLTVEGVFDITERTKNVYSYNGILHFQRGDIGVSLLGAYEELGGHTSLFIFGVVDAPIGGPEFAYVTGLAGGFGVNRSVETLPIEKINTSPFIEGATGTAFQTFDVNEPSSLNTAINSFGTALPVEIGEDWLAAGVKFKSYGLVNSFIMLDVQWGNETVIGLLGSSTVVIPAPEKSDSDGGDTEVSTGENGDDGETKNPIASATLDVQAVYNVDTGVLKIGADLAPSSYILNPGCVLTGGFGLYKWFKTQSAIAGQANYPVKGEFVMTFGGYSPNFKAPYYYPKVPRLGYNWHDGAINLKGGAYFALLPSTLMFGGEYNCTWSSGNLSAWFDMYADFKMNYKPFHYSANLGMTVGISYLLHLLFVNVRITVHLGVDAQIQGPNFSGTLTIDLDVVSFSISFGNPPPSKQYLNWNKFKDNFLPKGKAAPTSTSLVAVAGAGAPAPNPNDTHQVVSINPTKGLIPHQKTTGNVADTNSFEPDWIFDPEHAKIATSTFIPISGETDLIVQYQNGDSGKAYSILKISAPSAPSTFTGVSANAPMNISDVTSRHTVTIIEHPTPGESEAINMGYKLVTANLSRALWNLDSNSSDFSKAANPDKPLQTDACVGIELEANNPDDPHTVAVPTSVLLNASDGTKSIYWSVGTVPTIHSTWATLNSDTTGVSQMDEITSTIDNSPTKRPDILSSLNTLFGTSSTVEVDLLASSKNLELLAPPTIAPVISSETE